MIQSLESKLLHTYKLTLMIERKLPTSPPHKRSDTIAKTLNFPRFLPICQQKHPLKAHVNITNTSTAINSDIIITITGD